MNQEKCVHSGHRQRMKQKFLKNGLDDFEEHQILELLLFFGVQQGDTNPTAHRLLQKFGSIDRVFDAPYLELLSVKGVGENIATLLKLMPQIARVYEENSALDKGRAYSPRECARLLIPKFIGRTEEAVALLLLNAKGNVLFCDIIQKGSIKEVAIYSRKINMLALEYGATTAIIAHNHPSSNVMPSQSDMEATKKLMWSLRSNEITLADHLIVSGNNYTSFEQSCGMESFYKMLEIEKSDFIDNTIFVDELNEKLTPEQRLYLEMHLGEFAADSDEEDETDEFPLINIPDDKPEG